MIIGGVFERFPELRLVITELGMGWVAPLLQGLDQTFTAFPGMQAEQFGASPLTMKPSEYWRRQCFVTHSTSQHREHFEGDMFANTPNMVFGTDIGHAEGWWPKFGFPEPVPEGLAGFEVGLPVMPADEMVKTMWRDLPAARILPYLEHNFFRAYPNIDRSALAGRSGSHWSRSLGARAALGRHRGGRRPLALLNTHPSRRGRL